MKKLLSIIATSLLVLSVTSCKKESGKSVDISATINAFPTEELNADELASLSHMREEEKLAYDVYVTLYNKWGVSVFKNISESEETHTEAVNILLEKYNLADPVENHVLGVFQDSTLQSLYNQLVEQGNISQLEAFKVGATIEDLDIYDLLQWKSKIDNQDINYVFDNLTLGSRNHMRSFYSQIVNAGGTYSAQFISQSELDAIINSDKESGQW
jgi:hypothetical protein